MRGRARVDRGVLGVQGDWVPCGKHGAAAVLGALRAAAAALPVVDGVFLARPSADADDGTAAEEVAAAGPARRVVSRLALAQTREEDVAGIAGTALSLSAV